MYHEMGIWNPAWGKVIEWGRGHVIPLNRVQGSHGEGCMHNNTIGVLNCIEVGACYTRA